jgi:hypothetical protein
MNEWKIAYLYGDDIVVVTNGSAYVSANYDWDDNMTVDIELAAPGIEYFQKWMPKLTLAKEGEIPDRQKRLGEYAIKEILKDQYYVQALANRRARMAKK